MSLGTFLGLSAALWFFGIVALLVALGVFLVKRGVAKRAVDDAKQTLNQAAQDAANDVADKLGGK